MTIAKAITRTLDISVEDVRIDLTATIRSYDLTDTQFIFEIKSSNGMTVNLTGSTAMYIVEYVHNSQTYAIQGDVDIIGTDTLSFNLPEDLKGYSGTVLIGIYVKLTDGTKIDIKDIAVRIEPSIMDKDIDFSAKTYFKDFESVKAEVILEGEKAKTQIKQVLPTVNSYADTQKQAIDGVVSDVSGYADVQKQAIHNIVDDVQSTGDTAKADIKATLPSIQAEVSELKEDLADIDYIVFKDKISELTFNSEGSSSDITLDGNTITSTNATEGQYKAFTNTSLFEKGKKYIVVMKFENNSSTAITIYANAFSNRFAGSIGKTQGLGIGKSEISVISYIAQSDIRGFSVYSLTENATYTADIYVYDVTDKDTSNIDFSVGGTKIKILKSDLEKPYFGKILCTYGDSITGQQTWQDYVQRELGFSKYYNHGVGGRRLMTMATDECLAEITEDFDVILVMGGTNDWAQDRTIGTEADINTDEQSFTGTFYGGLNALMKKLTTKYPTKRIIFMTQTPVKHSNGEAFFNKKGSADGLKNSNGDTTRDFARATLNACGNNHVPCVDLNSLVGWNENNISSFVKNENDAFFHPTSVGGKRIAECISGFLKSLQSIN